MVSGIGCNPFPAVEAHSDIGVDVLLRRAGGEKHVLEDRHYRRLADGGVALQVVAVYVEARDKPHRALEMTLRQLEALCEDLDESKGFYLVRTAADLARFGKDENIGVLISIEGGEFLEAGKEMLGLVHRLGARMLGLTWNQRNVLASGIGDIASGSGLTDYGREIVAAMYDLGMILDVSHLAPAGVRDVLDVYPGVVIASHAGAKSVYNCDRNLSDEEIRALAQTDGVVGAPAFPNLLSHERPSVETVLDHIVRVIDVAGEDHAGIGADFVDFFQGLIDDGKMGEEWVVPKDRTTVDFESARDFPKLVACMKRRGFSDDRIAKIMGRNFVSAFQRAMER